jgi:hypothetical protein
MYNPNDYRHLKDDIIGILNREPVTGQSVAMLGCALGVPLIVIWTYVGEDMPEKKDEADEHIERLRAFYGIKE